MTTELEAAQFLSLMSSVRPLSEPDSARMLARSPRETGAVLRAVTEPARALRRLVPGASA